MTRKAKIQMNQVFNDVEKIEVVRELRARTVALQKKMTELERKNQSLLEMNTLLRAALGAVTTLNEPSTQNTPTAIKKESVPYKIGQKFRYLREDGTLSPSIYLLAQVDSLVVNLIGMDSGNRWTDSLIVPDSMRILKEEFDAHFVGDKVLGWVLLP